MELTDRLCDEIQLLPDHAKVPHACHVAWISTAARRICGSHLGLISWTTG